ncbi:GSCOCG00011405001-RA-CDS, partial [Cotesia congregata]
ASRRGARSSSEECAIKIIKTPVKSLEVKFIKNEKADEEAKNAARADQLNPNITATWEDTNKHIKSAVRKHWVNSWNMTYNSDNQATLSYETKTPPHHQLTRRDQCTITRLKIG